jgi:hypothetical protein
MRRRCSEGAAAIPTGAGRGERERWGGGGDGRTDCAREREVKGGQGRWSADLDRGPMISPRLNCLAVHDTPTIISHRRFSLHPTDIPVRLRTQSISTAPMRPAFEKVLEEGTRGISVKIFPEISSAAPVGSAGHRPLFNDLASLVELDQHLLSIGQDHRNPHVAIRRAVL